MPECVGWRHGWQVHTTLGMKCLCVYAVFFPVLSWPPNPWVQRNWSCWMSDPVIIPLITHCALPSRCRGPGAEKLRPGTTANTEHAPRQINKSGHIYHLFTSILCWTGINTVVYIIDGSKVDNKPLPEITVSCSDCSQGVRERAQVPQLVMLCRLGAHLQCFAGCTGRTLLCCPKMRTILQH